MASAPVPFRIDAQLQQAAGVLSFVAVVEQGASARAGVCKGDVVLAIGGDVVRCIKEVFDGLVRCRDDASVTIKVRQMVGGSVCDVVLLREAVAAKHAMLGDEDSEEAASSSTKRMPDERADGGGPSGQPRKKARAADPSTSNKQKNATNSSQNGWIDQRWLQHRRMSINMHTKYWRNRTTG